MICSSTCLAITSFGFITFLNLFLPYQPACIVFLVDISTFAPMIMVVIYIRAFALVYENCRVQSLREENKDIKLCYVESIVVMYFTFIKKFDKKHRELQSEPNSSKSLSRSALNAQLVYLRKVPGTFDGSLSDRVLIMSLIPFFVLCLSLLAVSIGVFKNDLLLTGNGCPHQLIYSPSLVFITISYFMIPIMLYSVFWIKRGLEIRFEIVWALVSSGILYIPFIAGFFVKGISPRLVGNGIYALAICYLTIANTVIYPIIKIAVHNYKRKYFKLDERTFKQVMDDPILYQELKDLMERDLCIENALFLEDYQTSLDTLKNMKNASLVNLDIAMNYETKAVRLLFEKYVAEGAPQQLNISHKLSKSIREVVKSGVVKQLELYVEVYDEVIVMIYENSFQRYIMPPVFHDTE